MSVGDCERAFAEAAASDGIRLVRHKSEFINQRGHFGLPERASRAGAVLEQIFHVLGGKPEEQAVKRLTPLPGDFIHDETGVVIEVDELQHFTSFRRLTFDHYPPEQTVNFDINEYKNLCDTYSSKADAYRRAKTAVGFGIGGRQRQRAYYDALRDLVLPTVGHPPIIRVAVLDGNGTNAYRANRDRIVAALAGR